MPNQIFRIVHLSDLHLTAKDDESRSEPKLFGKLCGMNEAFRKMVLLPQIQQCDQLIVTGDVSDSGEIDAWQIFWDAIKAAKLETKTLIIPGNHDACCLGLRIGLRRNLGKEDLERMTAGLKFCGQETKFPWAKQIDPRVVIFGLETNNEGNLTALVNAIGNIGYFQFLALGQLLKKYHAVPVKIVALHHSPNIPKVETAEKRGNTPLSGWERMTMQMQQQDREFLRVLCSSHGVRLVIHGHIHQADDREVAGVRIVGAPASTQPVKDGCFNYFEYSVHGAGGRVERKLRTAQV